MCILAWAGTPPGKTGEEQTQTLAVWRLQRPATTVD